jgi:hypothetical protein
MLHFTQMDTVTSFTFYLIVLITCTVTAARYLTLLCDDVAPALQERFALNFVTFIGCPTPNCMCIFYFRINAMCHVLAWDRFDCMFVFASIAESVSVWPVGALFRLLLGIFFTSKKIPISPRSHWRKQIIFSQHFFFYTWWTRNCEIYSLYTKKNFESRILQIWFKIRRLS